MNVLLCRGVLNVEVNLQPLGMYVLVRGDWHLEQVSEEPCFRRHLCTRASHMTYNAWRRALYGVFE